MWTSGTLPLKAENYQKGKRRNNMAWLLGDGFDFYQSANDLIAPGTVWSNATGSYGNIGGGNNTRYLNSGRSATVSNSGQMTTQPFANSSTIYLNFAYMTDGQNGGGFLPNNGSVFEGIGFQFQDVNDVQCTLVFRQQGDMALHSGAINSGSILANSTIIPTFTNDTWNHFQIKVVFSPTVGSIEVRLNGASTPDWIATNLNTRNGTTNNYCNKIKVNFPGALFYQAYLDDFYAFNDSGSIPNTWQGDVRAIQQYPIGDDTVAWTASTGASNFAMVDELRQDGNTTYVSASGAGSDMYHMSQIVTTYPIICVQPKMFFKMDDAGPHVASNQFKSGATTVTGPSTSTTTSYQWMQVPYPTDPNTSIKWLATDVNNVELGPVFVS
jgi:hypothetical protein